MTIPTSCLRALRTSWTRDGRAFRLRVEPGQMDDFASLEPFHYRPSRPATFSRILRIVDPGSGRGASPTLAGVMVVSFPALWATWRRSAAPGLFDSVESARNPVLVNRLVRTISRVIIDPRYRGLGAASQLVRAYLSSPCTPVTEAVTSMGRYHPLFESAGMTRFDPPTPPRHQRLEAALAGMGIRASDLIDLSRASLLIRDSRVAEALAVWHRRGRGSARRWRSRPMIEVAVLAGTALAARPVGYIHVQ
ncbi:MAG: hypothetical protein KF787_07685 [Phycisphaeraceae bacterium]|nr:hypothetical protein [Phycisphaeraceae bacterium]